jgi:hypothetical protein
MTDFWGGVPRRPVRPKIVQKKIKKKLTPLVVSAKLVSHTVTSKQQHNTKNMKKTLLIAAAALAAGIISTQAQTNVYSQNIVGYVNTQIPGGNAYSMITAPIGGATNLENTVTAITAGDNVLIWNGGGYTAYSYLGANWDGAGHSWADVNFNGVASPVVNPGQSFFYQNAQPGTETNTFVGNCILSNTVVIPGGNAYTLLASTAPIADTLDGTNLALPLTPGDNVLLWNGGGYTAYSYLGANWDGSGHSFADVNFNGVASPVINVGRGFFYQNSQPSAETWHQNFSVQ